MVKSLLFAQMCDSNFGGMHSKRSPTLLKFLKISEICKKICKIIVPQNKNSQISHNSHANFCIALSALSALSPSIVQIVQKVQSKFSLVHFFFVCFIWIESKNI